MYTVTVPLVVLYIYTLKRFLYVYRFGCIYKSEKSNSRLSATPILSSSLSFNFQSRKATVSNE